MVIPSSISILSRSKDQQHLPFRATGWQEQFWSRITSASLGRRTHRNCTSFLRMSAAREANQQIFKMRKVELLFLARSSCYPDEEVALTKPRKRKPHRVSQNITKLAKQQRNFAKPDPFDCGSIRRTFRKIFTTQCGKVSLSKRTI